MRTSHYVGVIVAILASATLVLDGQHRPPALSPVPPPPAAPPQIPGQPALARPCPPGEPRPVSPPQPTRVQIEFFQVATQQAALSKIDLDRVSEAGLPVDEILKRLADAGTAQLVVRLDETFDLDSSASFTHGTRLPTVQDMNVNKEGKVTPSVAYQDVGVSADISGTWLGKGVARVRCRLEMSGVGQTAVTIANGVQLPEFRRLKIDQQLILAHGKPCLLLGNTQAGPSDKDAHCTATIVRITAHRLGPDAEK